MENKQTDPNMKYKNTNEEENNRPERCGTSLTKKKDDITKTPQDSAKSEYGYMDTTNVIHQTDHFQKKFEHNFCDIQTAELEVKSEKPYDPRMDEPMPCGSDHKNGKEKGHCPIYYGIKSYLHDFYCPPDKDVLKSGEFMQGDDFRFLAEPRRKNNCWLRIGLWIGVNLIVLGSIAILVGYLTPQRQTVVGQFAGYTILDRWAVTFNNRLVLCQLTGLFTVLCGIVLVICSLLVASCQPQQSPTYYVMGATVLPESFVGSPLADPRHAWAMHSIPLSGKVKGVQPTFITY